MSEDIFSKFQTEEEQETAKVAESLNFIQMANQYSEIDDKERYIDPPRELPKRSYSLEPDMANGWKPKKNSKINLNNVFSINYDQFVVDQIVKELYKNKKKYKDSLAFLGPRRNNSYTMHEGRTYENPYPLDKKLDQLFSSRSGLPLNAKTAESFLKFQSDFEGGNLDLAIQRSSQEFDLYMRVDTNTRGHTNWFYFQISNGDFLGTIQFNICNFRREKSLYQRGLKPYIYSKLQDNDWKQGGKGIRYEKSKVKYDFLDQDLEEDFYYIEDQTHI